MHCLAWGPLIGSGEPFGAGFPALSQRSRAVTKLMERRGSRSVSQVSEFAQVYLSIARPATHARREE